VTHDALLAAVIANPDDDVVRLAFADWFEENDQPERAEFIRTQIERTRLPDDHLRHSELALREMTLLAEHGKEWFGFNPTLDQIAFRRGFVESIALRADHMVLRREIFRAHPIRELELVGASSGDGATLAECPELARIERLLIDSMRYEANEYEETTALLASKWLRNVRVLRLRTAFAEDDLRPLFARPAFAGLRELQINFGAADTIVDVLTKFPDLPLESLWVHTGQWGTCSLTHSGLMKLANSPHWKRLRELDVGVAPFDGEDPPLFGRVLSKSKLRTLRLRSWSLSNGSAEETADNLLAAKSWGKIESLTLGNIGFAADGLLKHPKLTQLRTLNLYRNQTADDLADRLFTCPALSGLRSLRVDVPCFSAVLASGKAKPMRGLRALQASLGPEAVRALATSPHLGALRRLHLNPIGTAGFKTLASATNLVHLNRLALLCPDGTKPAAANIAKFNNRSAFPNLGQLWCAGGSWEKTNLAPLLKRGSVPWIMLNPHEIDGPAQKQLEQREEKQGGNQAPVDERFMGTWDGE
jgi:uncharacterized protein (TIGR02996 family)